MKASPEHLNILVYEVNIDVSWLRQEHCIEYVVLWSE